MNRRTEAAAKAGLIVPRCSLVPDRSIGTRPGAGTLLGSMRAGRRAAVRAQAVSWRHEMIGGQHYGRWRSDPSYDVQQGKQKTRCGPLFSGLNDDILGFRGPGGASHSVDAEPRPRSPYAGAARRIRAPQGFFQ